MIRAVVLAIGIFAGAGNSPTDVPNCAAKPKGWLGPGDPTHLLANVILLKRDGAIAWNDRTINEQRVREYLKVASGLDPRPPVVLTYNDSVPCPEIARFRKLIATLYDCRGGLCKDGGSAPK